MRHLRTILILLLMLCCTLWAASYQWVTWHRSDGRLVWQLRDGGFTIGHYERDFIKDHPGTGVTYGLKISGYAGLASRWWPVFWGETTPGAWAIRGTFWLPTLLLALGIFVYPWARRKRRARQGHCPACGYDRRHDYETPCPECGSAANVN